MANGPRNPDGPDDEGFFGFGILPGSAPGEPARPAAEAVGRDIQPQLADLEKELPNAEEAAHRLVNALNQDNARAAFFAAQDLKRSLDTAQAAADFLETRMRAEVER